MQEADPGFVIASGSHAHVFFLLAQPAPVGALSGALVTSKGLRLSLQFLDMPLRVACPVV